MAPNACCTESNRIKDAHILELEAECAELQKFKALHYEHSRTRGDEYVPSFSDTQTLLRGNEYSMPNYELESDAELNGLLGTATNDYEYRFVYWSCLAVVMTVRKIVDVVYLLSQH
jgi:hypothetical protein